MKLIWTLLDWGFLRGIVRVLNLGELKHDKMKSEDGYINSIMRHLSEIRSGNYRDSETGEFHHDHITANLQFLRRIHGGKNEEGTN